MILHFLIYVSPLFGCSFWHLIEGFSFIFLFIYFFFSIFSSCLFRLAKARRLNVDVEVAETGDDDYNIRPESYFFREKGKPCQYFLLLESFLRNLKPKAEQGIVRSG